LPFFDRYPRDFRVQVSILADVPVSKSFLIKRLGPTSTRDSNCRAYAEAHSAPIALTPKDTRGGICDQIINSGFLKSSGVAAQISRSGAHRAIIYGFMGSVRWHSDACSARNISYLLSTKTKIRRHAEAILIMRLSGFHLGKR